MKKEVVICDICKRQFDPYSNERIKLKIRNENYWNFDNFEYRKWEKYDLCPSCAAKLVNRVREEYDENHFSK